MNLEKIGSCTCSNKTRHLLCRAWIPRAALVWTQVMLGWTYVPSSGQMTFSQSLCFLSISFLMSKIGTVVSKHHGVDVVSIKEVILGTREALNEKQPLILFYFSSWTNKPMIYRKSTQNISFQQTQVNADGAWKRMKSQS